jgi:hypothetical protein
MKGRKSNIEEEKKEGERVIVRKVYRYKREVEKHKERKEAVRKV